MKTFATQQKEKTKGMRPAAAHDRQSASKAVANHVHLQRATGTQAVQRLITPGTLQFEDNRPKPGDVYTREVDKLKQRVNKTFSNPLSQQKATIPGKQTREIPPANSSYQLTAMSYELPSMSNVETRPPTPKMETVASFVRGDPKRELESQTQEIKAKAVEDETKKRFQLASDLMNVQDQIGTGMKTEEIKKKIGSLIGKLTDTDER